MKSFASCRTSALGMTSQSSPSSENGWSETYVVVAQSGHFFGWLVVLGTDVKIIGEESVAEEMRGLGVV